MQTFTRCFLPALVVSVGLAAARPAQAARFELPPGGQAQKHFGVPKRVQFAVSNIGDCSARICGLDGTGRLFFDDEIAPGETTVYTSPTRISIGIVQAGFEGAIGAVLVARGALSGTTYRYETPEGTVGCNNEERDIYVQFDTCPPTLSPVITVKNLNDDCDIIVVAVRATGADWTGTEDEDRFRLRNGEQTPPFQGVVRKWKVRCDAQPSGRDVCRFEWTL